MIQQLSPHIPDYELIDSGEGEKLERFGQYVVRRPEPQAIWRKSLGERAWRDADASFLRDNRSEERGEWRLKPEMPSRWSVRYDYKDMHLRMRLALTSFKHVGIFPEQAANWMFIYDTIEELRQAGIERPKVLNLFAYTGGASLAARAAGADVTHVDSVKQVVTWSRENMEQSQLDGIRWIVEDATKFVEREVRRGNKYHGIILDPRPMVVAPMARSGYSKMTYAICWSAAHSCWSRAMPSWSSTSTLWDSRRCSHARRCTRPSAGPTPSRWASYTSRIEAISRYPLAPTTALDVRLYYL